MLYADNGGRIIYIVHTKGDILHLQQRLLTINVLSCYRGNILLYNVVCFCSRHNIKLKTKVLPKKKKLGCGE